MCKFSGRLVAWIDGELPESEATNVEWHVAGCAECRSAVQSFEEVSRAFLTSYEQSVSRTARRPRWMFVASGAAAAAAAVIVATVLLWPRPVERLPVYALPTVHAPPIAYVHPSVNSVAVRARGRMPKPIRSTWAPSEPMVEVELPADVLFPPGAVPEGFSFIAEVRTQP